MKQEPYKKFFKEDRRNILPKSFEAWIEKTFGDFSHFLMTYDIQDDAIYYGGEDEEGEDLDNLRASQLTDFSINQEERFNNWIWKYQQMQFPMTLYRVVQLQATDIDNISDATIPDDFKKGVGIYWTDGEGSMEAYWGQGGKNYTIRATVNEENINWKDTLYNNMNPSLGELESEIQLNKGTKIILTGIAEGVTPFDDKFEPLNVAVRA